MGVPGRARTFGSDARCRIPRITRLAVVCAVRVLVKCAAASAGKYHSVELHYSGYPNCTVGFAACKAWCSALWKSTTMVDATI